MERKTIPALILLLAVIQSPLAQKPAAPIDDAALRGADSRRADWITHGRTYSETRFGPLDQINSTNVRSLGLAWSFDTESTRGLEAKDQRSEH